MKLSKVTFATIFFAMIGGCIIEATAKIKCVPKIYAFGFAASFNDSTVYFTDIQEIDSAWINDKNDFLIIRDNYSYQLKNYLSGIGLEHRTCVISFALERKDVVKKYNKMKSKYVKAGNFIIKGIDKADFQFSAIKPDDYLIENNK